MGLAVVRTMFIKYAYSFACLFGKVSQIRIRIGSEEWAVLRRYSNFYELHKFYFLLLPLYLNRPKASHGNIPEVQH
jgi:hypothetical protein